MNLKERHLLTVFLRISDEVKVTMKGCFSNPNDCNGTECIDTTMGTKNNLNYCCCRLSMCNREHRWVPNVTNAPEPVNPVPPESSSVIVVASVVTGTLALCSMIVIFVLRRRKQSMFNEIPTVR